MFGHILLGYSPKFRPYIYRPYIWNRYLQSIGSCCMAIESLKPVDLESTSSMDPQENIAAQTNLVAAWLDWLEISALKMLVNDG